MPPKKKKTRPTQSDDGEDVPEFSVAGRSDGNSSDSDSSVDSQMEVQVEFEARMIDETDFHGIRRLLQQAFLKAPLDLSGLTDLLISQARHIGSVVKVSDDHEDGDCDDGEQEESDGEGNEVYGVTSAISLTHHKDKVCVKQLYDWLMSQCKTHCGGDLSQLTALLNNDSKPAAFLINERFLNIPVDIAPLLLKTLVAEMKEAEKRHPDQFAVEYYVIIARSHLVSMPKLKMGKKRKKKATVSEASNSLTNSSADEPIFDFYENELIHRASTLSFSYPVGEESDQVLGGKWDMDDKTMKPFRTLMVIEAKKLECCIVELEQAIRSN